MGEPRAPSAERFSSFHKQRFTFPARIRFYSFAARKRSALLMTDTELKLMAAAAMIGLNKIPNLGYRMPAAMGTPTEL